MNLVVLYLLLVKATLLSFSGMTSLAVVRQDLVVERRLLTDAELTTAVAAGRLAPGPNGVYLVAIGYHLGGYPGAAMGWLALVTPAFLSIPLVGWLGRHREHPVGQRVLDSVLLASAGLSLASALPLAREAIVDARGVGLAVAAGTVLFRTRIDSFWVILGCAATALLYSALP
ncbi:MAG: chromate transporter [Acidobacteriota bacterium]|jgi:chromate transporter